MQPDLSALPNGVRAAARLDPNGEVSWLDSDAADAINGLADCGSVVLGLDVRFYDSDGRFYEIAWSSFNPDSSESARAAALGSLAHIDGLEIPDDIVERRVLVTWR